MTLRKDILHGFALSGTMTWGNGHSAQHALAARGPSLVPTGADVSSMMVTLTSLAELSPAQCGAWDALAADCAEPNSFGERWFLAAGIANLSPASHDAANSDATNPAVGAARLAFVHTMAGELIGVAPIGHAPRFGRVPLHHTSVWSHPNSFLAPILIRHSYETAFWAALLTSLSQNAAHGPLLCVEQLPEDGAMAAGLRAAATTLGVRIVVEHHLRRALLTVPADPDAYWDNTVRAKKRKELRRQWSRLAELGPVEHRALGMGDDVAPWIDQFLTLEQAGWKGAEGSALASAPATQAFFTAMAHAAHANGQLDIRAILLDGTPIAMLITLIAGDVGYSWKTAYDERYARFSPGVLIQRDSIAQFRKRGLRWIDSCAAEDHPMIDSLWQGRRAIVTLSVALPGRANRARFAAVQLAKSAWHGIKSMRASGPSA